MILVGKNGIMEVVLFSQPVSTCGRNYLTEDMLSYFFLKIKIVKLLCSFTEHHKTYFNTREILNIKVIFKFYRETTGERVRHGIPA